MKKIIAIMLVATSLFVAVPALASKNDSASQGGADSDSSSKTQQMPEDESSSPLENQEKNENQMQIQNQGDDTQINTKNQEQENLEDGQRNEDDDSKKEAAPRSDTAKERMSDVAEKVEELLMTEGMDGGIGQQVKQIAQEQKTSQQQVQAELQKVDSRRGLLKSIIGPDFKALKNMEKLIEQNKLRIQQLTQSKNQLSNEEDVSQVQEMIQALTEQNYSLTERINLETKSGSLLGWLFKMFSR